MPSLRRVDATERFPETFQFLGGYLHQHWPEDYGTADEAVRVAIAESGADRLRGVERELPSLLRLSDNDLERQSCVSYATTAHLATVGRGAPGSKRCSEPSPQPAGKCLIVE